MKRFVAFFFLLCSLPLFAFCEKPEIIIEDTLSKEAKPAFDRFNELVNNGNISETFLFFTDPHLLGAINVFSQDDRSSLIGAFDVAKELYDTLKLGFCLCGGDWLNFGDTQEMAKEKLLFADQQMKMKFTQYYKMMGNHDTNYQGIVSLDDPKRGDLPRAFIDNEYFSETGSAYFSFSSKETQYLVLDSGIDYTLKLDDYRWEQIKWFANQLKETNNKHVALLVHMFYSEGELTPMSKIIVEICDAYNKRQSVSLNGLEYDFSSVNGKIHFVLAGHSHYDSLTYEGVDNNLPVIETCNYTINGSKSFELCLVDYEKNILHLVRVGKGKDRSIDFI